MVAIVTDSTACFTNNQAVENNIIILPMKYQIADKLFQERYISQTKRINDSNIYFSKTAATSVYDYYSAFKKLTDNKYEVICLTISSRFSSAFSNAVTASLMLISEKNKIFVVDSKLTGGGLHLLAQEASRLACSQMKSADIIKKLMEFQKNIGIAFSVSNMSILRKSGRIGVVSESIGTILNIRPILLCKNGTVISDGIARGSQMQISRLINKIPENAKQIIIHGKKDDKLTQSILKIISKKFTNYKLLDIGNVLSIHLGADVIGLAWI